MPAVRSTHCPETGVMSLVSLAVLRAVSLFLGLIGVIFLLRLGWHRWRRKALWPPSEQDLAFLMVLPAALGILIFYLYPLLQAALLSFHQPGGQADWLGQTFVGGQNYTFLWSQSRFWVALRYTLYFTGLAVGLELLLGLAMALFAAYAGGQRWNPWRALLILPWAIPPIVAAAIWKWLLNADVGLGAYLTWLPWVKEPPLFLVEPWLAMHSVIVVDVWKMTPLIAILLLAGLTAISPVLYEAARIDGAGVWQRFRYVTWPLLQPTLLVAGLYRTIDALRTFDLVYGLTNGGPGNLTETLSSLSYKWYFSQARFGLGAAYSMVLLGLTLVLVWGYLYRLRRNLPGVD